MDEYTTEDVMQFEHTLNDAQKGSIRRLVAGGYFEDDTFGGVPSTEPPPAVDVNSPGV